jgi:hypothetical protein
VRAAHDPARLALTDVYLAPPNRLAVLLLLILERQHPAEHQRPAQTIRGGLDLLDLQAHPHQGVTQRPRLEVVRQVDVFGDPGDRRAHLRPPFRRLG